MHEQSGVDERLERFVQAGPLVFAGSAVGVAHAGEVSRLERSAPDGGELENPPSPDPEAVDATAHHSLDRGRKRHRSDAGVALEATEAAIDRHAPPGDQEVEEFFREQRMPGGALEQKSQERGRDFFDAESQSQELLDGRVAEGAHPKSCEPGEVAQQLLDHGCFSRPRSDDEHRRVGPPGQNAQHRGRSRIEPMRVLDDQQRRHVPVAEYPRDRRRHLLGAGLGRERHDLREIRHAERRRDPRRVLRGLVFSESGALGEGRGDPFRGGIVRTLRGAGLPSQSPLQEAPPRVVGRLFLDRVAAGDRDGMSVVPGVTNEVVHDAGFSDARLAFEEDTTALPASRGPLERHFEGGAFVLATHRRIASRFPFLATGPRAAGLDRSRLSTNLQRKPLAEIHRAPAGLARVPIAEDAPLGHLGETRGEVHRIAEQRVLAALAGSHRPAEHEPGRNADADRLGSRRESLRHAKSGDHRAIGIVVVGSRRKAEGDQHRDAAPLGADSGDVALHRANDSEDLACRLRQFVDGDVLAASDPDEQGGDPAQLGEPFIGAVAGPSSNRIRHVVCEPDGGIRSAAEGGIDRPGGRILHRCRPDLDDRRGSIDMAAGKPVGEGFSDRMGAQG